MDASPQANAAEPDKKSADKLPPAAYTVSDIVEISGLSRATVFREMKSGRLPAKKVGARTLVLAVDWQDYLDNLPPRAA
jgi:hypothetical protein